MPRDTQPPVTDSQGREHHPAFGICRIGRISSHPGASLFQSDVRHAQYIQVTLSGATRHRNLHHDWVHAGHVIAQFDLSMAQFASLITSGGTEGIPVTVSYTEGMGPVPGLDYDPRLAHTTTEARKAAHTAYQDIKDALDVAVEVIGVSAFLADPVIREAASWVEKDEPEKALTVLLAVLCTSEVTPVGQ